MSIYSPLTWTRMGTMGRPLLYVGRPLVFSRLRPVGPCPIYRDKDGLVMTFSDASLVLTAQRKQESK
jgi:hypothetical protein